MAWGLQDEAPSLPEGTGSLRCHNEGSGSVTGEEEDQRGRDLRPNNTGVDEELKI